MGSTITFMLLKITLTLRFKTSYIEVYPLYPGGHTSRTRERAGVRGFCDLNS